MDKTEIQNLIKDLIEKTNVKVSEMSVHEDKESTWYRVEVTEPHFYIDRDGEGLMALNHLVRRITDPSFSRGAQPDGVRSEIMIDINGFQKKRIDAIHAVAHMMAERARYFKSNVEVDPMSSFERRVVHEFLADATDLKTESVGFGPNRRVVIQYTGSL